MPEWVWLPIMSSLIKQRTNSAADGITLQFVENHHRCYRCSPGWRFSNAGTNHRSRKTRWGIHLHTSSLISPGVCGSRRCSSLITRARGKVPSQRCTHPSSSSSSPRRVPRPNSSTSLVPSKATQKYLLYFLLPLLKRLGCVKHRCTERSANLRRCRQYNQGFWFMNPLPPHLQVWNAGTGECLETLRGHTGWVSCITISRSKVPHHSTFTFTSRNSSAIRRSSVEATTTSWRCGT